MMKWGVRIGGWLIMFIGFICTSWSTFGNRMQWVSETVMPFMQFCRELISIQPDCAIGDAPHPLWDR